jgi:vacuolar-type H+-ATPase subunit H
MVDNEKLNAAASQAKDQASEFAAQAREKADELMAKAAPVVSEAAAKIAEYAVKAGEAIADRVDGVAANVKSATSGKHADKIDAVGTKLKKILDPDRQEGDSAEPPPAP